MAVAVQIECQSVSEGFFSGLFLVDFEVLVYGIFRCLVCALDNAGEMYGVKRLIQSARTALLPRLISVWTPKVCVCSTLKVADETHKPLSMILLPSLVSRFLETSCRFTGPV